MARGCVIVWIVQVVVFPARLSWCVTGTIERVVSALDDWRSGVFLVAGAGAGSFGCGAESGVFGSDWRGRFLVRAGVGALVCVPLIRGGVGAMKLWFGPGAYIV